MLNTQMLAQGAEQVPIAGGGDTTSSIPVLRRYLNILARAKWLILGIIAVCVAAGLVVTLLMTPKYTATARVEIAREQKNVTKVEGLEPDSGRDLEFYQTQYALLGARSLAERVARDLRLATRDEFFEAHGVRAGDDSLFFGKSNRPLTPAERGERERKAVELLLRHVTVDPIRGSSLVDVSYTSGSPALATEIANAWTKQFINASMDRRFASTADARKFLEARLADVRARLEESERNLVHYAEQKGIVALSKSEGDDGKTRTEQTLLSTNLQVLNAALLKATADRIAAETKERGGGANPDALNYQAIGELRQKRAEVAAEYAKGLSQFAPDYPPVKALAEQMRTLDRAIAAEVGRVQASRSTEYREAVARENRLRTRVNELESKLGAQQRDSIQLNIYQRDADTNRELYAGLLQRYKEIGVAGVGSNNISVIDPAKVPDRPSSPRLGLNLLLSLLAGMGIAAAVVLGLEQIDESVHAPDAVERLLGVPLLGAVPQVDDSSDVVNLLGDPKSGVYEAYFSIRSSLALTTDHGVPRTLLVTSTRPAEGKSVTSISLATVLTRTGRKVLVVDADMRSPSISSKLELSNDAGLSNVLAGTDDWQALVTRLADRGFDVLTAGPMPPSASELLSGDRMSELLDQAAKVYDHIVIDAPPLLALADSLLLARAVEGAILVVEAGGVSARAIKASLSRLQAHHAHVLGVVLTKLRRSRAGESYGYGYGYGYGYEYGQTRADGPASS